MKSILIAASVLMVVGLAPSGRTEASVNDASRLPQTKLTLARAVAIAEESLRGRAVRAELEHTKEGLSYDIEIVADKTVVHDVVVDAQSGKVVRSNVDTSDDDDRDDHVD